ncbi:MAG: hypothetical protein VCA55_10790 [Verrucomicrobiales bacterium]
MYARQTEQFRDSCGIPPRHTFFYPIEQYNEQLLAVIAELCAETGCETEIHLHHNSDTAENLRKTLARGKSELARHQLLSVDEAGQIVFGFIHGNWALANCDPRGINCGVANEISVLQKAGCYADFTMPSAPHPTQPKTINSIYYSGIESTAPLDEVHPCAVNSPGGEGLLMVQGPLGLNWRWRKWGILPRIENGSLSAKNPPTITRMNLWRKLNIRVSGCDEWVFIKLHTHGAIPSNRKMLLGNPMSEFHKALEAQTRTETSPQLHYASAREMVNMIHAAEDGMTGNPGDFRNYRYHSIMHSPSTT